MGHKNTLKVCNVLLNLWVTGYLGQGIQEWNKLNLWKTAFKKFEVIWSA